MKEILEKLINALTAKEFPRIEYVAVLIEEARVALAKDQVIADHYIAKLKEAARVWEEQESHIAKMYSKLEVQRHTYHEMWYEEAKKAVAAEEEVKRLKQRFGVTE